MKICITSLGNNLEAEVDPRFGRCRYFIIVDSATPEFEAIENLNIAGRGGVGIQSAQLVSNKGVEVVLTGNTGPNAYQVLEAAGIKVIAGVTGKVGDVIEKFKKGEYEVSSSSTVDANFGLGRAANPARTSFQETTSKNNNGLDELKKQAETMKENLERISKKIEELEKRKT